MTADFKRGLFLGLGAYFLWGFFPLYFRQLEGNPALEILLHRAVWSVPVLGLLLWLLRRPMAPVWALFKDRRALLISFCSATLLAANWLIFIWAIELHRVLESSLGYYINPLISVLLGMVFLRERLSPVQAVAVAIAGIGVLVMALEGESFPWMAISMALTFGLYGLLRKTMKLGAMEGLFVETLLLLPLALPGLIWWMSEPSRSHFNLDSIGNDLLLISVSLVTIVPLSLWAGAARRLPLSMVGMMQYIAPTLHFVTAVFLFGEAFTQVHAITFACIWAAVGLFMVEGVRGVRRLRAA